jgi:ABC-type glycerol-3-phosphate transport system substrate-binding protein
MASRKAIVGLAAVAAATLLLTSCTASGSGDGGGSDEVAGDITFLTNRTDLQTDGTWDEYIAEFQKEYPDVDVKVEAITNYEDDVKTRLSTPNGYGDVLLIPNSVAPSQYPDFFEPLGDAEDLADTYRFLAPKTVDGVQYGIALGGNANGVLYNTEVFADAGVTEAPTTEADFLAALEAVKGTGAVPLYTNYKDGWPLGGQWTNIVGAVTGDPDAQTAMAHDEEPWTEGTDIYALDSLLFDAVHEGLTEEDPLTTNWEQSKGDFATGRIGSMVLGSWAISQFQAAAEDAGVSKDVVGFMPFPTNVGGQQYATIAGDYYLGVNKNSGHTAAAKAWLDWLIEDSGFTDTQGMISAVKSAPLPENLGSLEESGVELVELSPAPAGEESLFSDTADRSQVDVWGNIYRQKLIDIARGEADGDKDSYFAQLNEQWGSAVSELAG